MPLKADTKTWQAETFFRKMDNQIWLHGWLEVWWFKQPLCLIQSKDLGKPSSNWNVAIYKLHGTQKNEWIQIVFSVDHRKIGRNQHVHPFFSVSASCFTFQVVLPLWFSGFLQKKAAGSQSGTLLVINGVTNNPTRSGSSPGTDLTAAPRLLAAEALFTSVCLQPHATIVCCRFASYSAVAGDDARSYVFLVLATIFWNATDFFVFGKTWKEFYAGNKNKGVLSSLIQNTTRTHEEADLLFFSATGLPQQKKRFLHDFKIHSPF